MSDDSWEKDGPRRCGTITAVTFPREVSVAVPGQPRGQRVVLRRLTPWSIRSTPMASSADQIWAMIWHLPPEDSVSVAQ
jgi:hypothetical protein